MTGPCNVFLTVALQKRVLMGMGSMKQKSPVPDSLQDTTGIAGLHRQHSS